MSANMKSNRYCGKLGPVQISQGMNCANANAKRLLEDAELLFQNGRYPSAVGLAILAIEEAGKEAMLRCLSVARNAEELKSSWKDFRTHTSKNWLAALPRLISSGALNLEDFASLFKDPKYSQSIENLKQISIYSDCIDDARWSSPGEVVDEKVARSVVAAARLAVKGKSLVTEKEVELWIKHIGPVWKQDLGKMETALKDWFADLARLGLFKGSLDSATRFIDGKKRWVN